MESKIGAKISKDYFLYGNGNVLELNKPEAQLKSEITERVRRDGIVLLRNIGVSQPADFKFLLDTIDVKPMNYMYRSTPRTEVLHGIHTSTEYPPQLEIPLHCENSYQLRWPTLLAFCCLQAASGGQTTIADVTAVTSSIGSEIMNEISSRGIKYVRHYHPRMDLPWQEVFQTSSKAELEAYCRLSRIDFHWLEREILRTEQICQGVILHPSTGKMIHFNQAHLFHPVTLGDEYYEDMIALFGRDRLPRMALFGDGGEIPAPSMAAIRRAFEVNAQEIDWMPGDVALIDNRRFAHGRRAYRGERRVLAALLNPSDSAVPLA